MNPKTYIVGIGGCGVNNVANHAKQNSVITALLGDNVVYRYIDTTVRSVVANDIGENSTMFHRVTNGGAALDGSGGEQNTNAELYRPTAQEFIKKEKLNSDNFVHLVTSASGGTGSRLSVVLLDELLKKNIPVCCIVVGDVKHLRHKNATVDTLKRLNLVCHTNDSSAIMRYYNNDDGMNNVDEGVSNTLNTMLCYLSGSTTIDRADMRRLYMPTSYITMDKLPSRLYIAEINGAYTDGEKIIYKPITSEDQPQMAMSLTTGNIDVELPVCYAAKTGVTKENAVTATLHLKPGVDHTLYSTLKLSMLIESIEADRGFVMPKVADIDYGDMSIDF